MQMRDAWRQKDSRELRFSERELRDAEGAVLATIAVALLGPSLDAHFEETNEPFTTEYRELRSVLYDAIGQWLLQPENQLTSAVLVANPKGIERRMVVDLAHRRDLAAIVTAMGNLFIRDSRGSVRLSTRHDQPVPEEIMAAHPERYLYDDEKIQTTYIDLAKITQLRVEVHPDSRPGQARFVVSFVQLPNELEAMVARQQAQRQHRIH